MVFPAPDNCLQYFTGRQGTVTSFNWSATGPARVYPANQDYAVCFRRQPGDCQPAPRRSASAPAKPTSGGKAPG